MAFRYQWVSQLISGLLMTALNLFIFFVIYSHTDSIAGWGPWEVVLLVGYTQVCQGLLKLFVSGGVMNLQNLVDSGDLDGILIRPMPSQAAISLRTPNVFGVLDVIFGILTVVFAYFRLEDGTVSGIGGIGLSFFCVLVATCAIYAIWYISMTITIWFKQLWSWAQIIPNMIDFSRFPADVFGPRLQLFFRFAIPVLLIANLPVEALRGNASLLEVALAVTTAAVLLIVSVVFWKFALKHYSSASS